ncbi:MAG: MATE family efflux transporter [Lachnospiraceae bacterium]
MQIKSLTTAPIFKLFFRYLIPSICGTMVTSIYVLADTIVIGKGLGIDAMAALNIILPIFNLFFGTGLLFGVGGSVLMSICRGRGDYEAGNTYFTISLLLNSIALLFWMILGVTHIEEIVRFLGATDVTMPYIMSYIPYVIWGMGVFFFSSFLQTFIRNDGAPKLAMIAVITGGILNVILDCLFVFTFHMGMAGASIASVIGAFVTVCILCTHFFSKHNGLHLCLKGFRILHIRYIFGNGLTSFLTEMSYGIVMFIFNLQLIRYVGDIGVSVFGIITNTVIVVNCLCNGINQAAQPIISTNFGAGLYSRTHQVQSLGLKTAAIICSVPTLIGLFFPKLFVSIFLNPNEQILALAPTAIRIMFLAFVGIGLNMFIISYFQSTIQSMYSLGLCLLRSCILSVILVYLLPMFFGVNGIWIASPLAEILSLSMGLYLLKKTTKGELA